MNFSEKKLHSEKKYNGVIINVRVDNVELQDGKVHKREVVEHPGGVVILPITDDNKLILIRQWRYPVQDELIELPAGKLEKGEDPFESAKRELEEETGHVANSWHNYGYIYSTPGFCNEKLYIYKAWDLEKTQMNLDDGEQIEPFEVTIEEAKEMVKSGKIKDAKTIIGISYL